MIPPDYIALFATLAPPGTMLAVGGYLHKKITTSDSALASQAQQLATQAWRLERMETSLDRLVDHLITRKKPGYGEHPL